MKRLIAMACCVLGLAGTARADNGSERAKLEERLKALETALSGDVCLHPEAARALLAAAASGGSASPISAPADLTPAADSALGRDALVGRLKQAVVMVLTPEGSGSGFFITPDTLVTNSHVVEGADPSKIILIGPAVGGARPAKLIARVSGEGMQARDYALLKIAGAPAKASLPISAAATELEPVVAAGFPGLLIANDIQFQKLLHGTPTGMPDLILSQGSIMAIQNRSSALPTIAHSAAISAGNSGGPLVDTCGRVVGVNTFIRVSVDQASHAGYAIASDDILRFLAEQHVSPTIKTGPCG
jgi:S1-C subfamily serine protease